MKIKITESLEIERKKWKNFFLDYQVPEK
jgi:hypothetical protein